MSVRLNLSVDPDIPDLLSELAGGERKRGEYLARLVRSIHAGRSAEAVTVERLQAQIDGLLAQLRQVEGQARQVEDRALALEPRLLRVERECAALIAAQG